jgi:hypothetical protein
LRQCVKNPKKASAKISRIFRRFRAHGLIAKIPCTRRWRVTLYGRRVILPWTPACRTGHCALFAQP